MLCCAELCCAGLCCAQHACLAAAAAAAVVQATMSCDVCKGFYHCFVQEAVTAHSWALLALGNADAACL